MRPHFDLGAASRRIQTSSTEAQHWFDLGLNWCFGFNQEEGLACFQKALKHDPECAMAHWGVAYAAGPFYNMPWCDFSRHEAQNCTRFCYGHIQKAKELVRDDVEGDIIDALAARVQADHPVTRAEYDAWDDAYADAMRAVYHKYPTDLDVVALFAEAMMTRTPWKLWNVKTNEPAPNADTLESLSVLERAIELQDILGKAQHPAILHLHIHVLEMSPTPERALRSADILGTLCPDAGHMNHMPSHIYVLCGFYEKAKAASEKAIIADRKYLEYAGPYNFYTTARCHDLHMMMYTCMFLGQFTPAMAAAKEMCGTLSPDVLDVKGKPYLAMTMEGYYSMMMHVLVRFGRWQEIIDTPMPACPMLYCVSTAMHHYGKTVAFAALGRIDEAETRRNAFHASLEHIPEDRRFFNNPAITVLGVAEAMLNGELEYHKGNQTAAYDHLRQAVQRNDDLAYSEPWAWMHPPRHALGALLLEQGFYTEAEEVYRTNLGLDGKLQRCAQHHGDIWALHGFVECLERRGETAEAALYRAKRDAALAKADTAITSSCFCRKMTADVCCS